MSDDCPRISVSLVVGGDDFDTAQLSHVLSINPTRVWSQKIPHLRERGDLPNCEWEYKIERAQHWSIDEAIQQVLDVVWTKRNALCQFAEENKLSTAIVCYVFNETTDPEYTITLSTLKRIVELGAEFSMQLDD